MSTTRSGSAWTGAVVVSALIAVTGCASDPPGASVPEPAGPFIRQPSWEGDCTRRPPGTVCAVFPDGYVWLLRDAVMGWSAPVGEWEGQPIEAVVGRKAVYYRVRGTYMVYVGPLEESPGSGPFPPSDGPASSSAGRSGISSTSTGA